ncbi:MAG TPA: XdhC family protein [Vicinamibacterales bacterium]
MIVVVLIMPLDLDFYERIARLGREGQSFAVATVVGRRAPVSSHLGDHAVIFASGRMEGFVGGACSHEIVRTQALEVLATGKSRMVSIRPDASSFESSRDHVVVPMTCVSEGAVDVYIEPFVRPRLLVIAGATPIASAVAKLARSLDYRVVRVVEERERADLESEASALGYTVSPLDTIDDLLKRQTDGPDDRAVVVASQGHYDEEAVAAALKSGVPYVALVASRARGETVKSLLKEQNVPGIEALRNPAGLDLGAQTAPEVALSILAEIVQARLNTSTAVTPVRAATAPAIAKAAATAIDPVCDMEVDIATARYKADFEGVTYYFCCASCKSRFLKQPHEYLSHTG